MDVKLTAAARTLPANRYRAGTAVLAGPIGRMLWTALLAGLVLQGLESQRCDAQFGMQPTTSQAGRFIDPPRAILQVINDAQRAIDAERYSDAVVSLGDMLARQAVAQEDADLAGQDFFLDASEPQYHVSRSMMREAERVLASLPTAGRELYEVRYGAKARQMLDAATATRDRGQLAEISRRYLLTDAGMDATYLLARLNLSEGRPVAAIAMLRRLAAIEAARIRFGNGLLLLLAESESLAGSVEAADEHLAAAKQMNSEIELATKNVNLPSGNASDWLNANFGSLQRSPTKGLRTGERGLWVARGGVAGLGPGDGNLPLSRIRWDRPTTTNRPHQRELEEFVGEAGVEIPPPSWQPIKVGSQLLMRTTERLMAVDFETGMLIWEYPWANGTDAQTENSQGMADLNVVDNARELLIQRVWNDLPYGRVTSDGRRVYVLDDLGEMEMMPINAFGMPMVRRRADTSSNTLVALDLAAEGKIVWTRGKSGIEGEERSLAEAFFMGPPLPVEGKLYQIAELAGDVYLLCLNPDTGNEIWRQQILGNDGGRVGSEPLRRMAGATPAYSNGILVCPTGGGAIIAFDLASRTLLWGHQLPANDMQLTMSQRARGRYNSGPMQADLLNRWHDGTPTICDNTVLVTPVESESLYGFDLLTGKPVWAPILRRDYRYLAGCRDGQFFLVSNNRVQAYSLKKGTPSWTSPATVGSDEQVAGTGVFGDDSYFLPTSSGSLIEVGLATGEIKGRRKVDFPLGNLLADGDSFVSQTATVLSAAYIEQPLREIVEDRLESSDTDRWAMVRQGELLLQEGNREGAIEWLLRAREIDREDEEVRVLLVDALLTSIRNGKRPDEATTRLLDELIQLAPQRVELLRLKAIGALEENRPSDAIGFVIELSRIVLREEQALRSNNRTFQKSPQVKTSIDAWCASMVRDCIKEATEQQRTEIRQMIAAYVEPLIAYAAPIKFRTLNQFGSSTASDPLRASVWRNLVDNEEYGRAERLALDGIMVARESDPTDSLLVTAWQVRLSELYSIVEFHADALAYAKQAIVESPDAIDTDSIARLELFNAATKWPSNPRLVAAGDDRLRAADRRDKLSNVDIVSIRGEHLANWQPKLDQSGAILLRDPLGMDHRIDLQTASGTNEMVQATIDGGLMIFLTSEEIIAVDRLALNHSQVDAILWRRKWWNQGASRSRRSQSDATFFQHNRKVYTYTNTNSSGELETGAMRLGPVVGRRFFILQGSDVIAIDTLNGDELWRSSGHPGDAFLSADASGATVVSPKKGEFKILSYYDGSELKTDFWEPSEEVIVSAGSNLLTLRTAIPNAEDNQGTTRILRLFSPTEGNAVLETEFRDGFKNSQTFARIVDGRYLITLNTDRRLLVWDLLFGLEIHDDNVEFEGRLTGFQVVRNNDMLVLALIRSEERDVDAISTERLSTQDGSDHREVDGPLIAIGLSKGLDEVGMDTNDGGLQPQVVRWQHELNGPWGISLDQAAASPLIALTRSRTTFQDTGRGDRTLDLLAVDVRDGSTGLFVNDMSVLSNFTALRTETRVIPEQDLVEIAVNRYVFYVEFVEDMIDAKDRSFDAETIKEMMDTFQQNMGQQSIQAIEAP